MSLVQDFTDVARAAQKFHVPFPVLWGIYGKETGFGTNVKTNSKGYTGPFQFGPHEAAQYHYPLTNKPSRAQFQQQADAAAHLLADRIKATGSVDAAVRSYSGGGYGEKDALDKAKETPQHGLDPTDVITGPIDAAKDAANAVADGVSSFYNLITSLEFWLRIGEGIAGLILIAMGLKTLTGVTIPTPIGRV